MTNTGSRVLAILVLVLLTLPTAFIGGCSVWIGASVVLDGVAHRATSGAAGLFVGVVPLFFGVIGIAGFVGSIALARKLWKG